MDNFILDRYVNATKMLQNTSENNKHLVEEYINILDYFKNCSIYSELIRKIESLEDKL